MNGTYCADVAMDAGWFDKRLWTSIGGGRKTASNIVVTHDNAMTNSAVWCANRLLCGTGASLPLPLYQGRDDGTRVKRRDHALWRLLNIAPNPEQTAFSFRSVMWYWQANWGNAYAEIVREGNDQEGQVVALWPLHPKRVKVCRDKDSGELYYSVRGEDNDPSTELQPWQMLHVPSIITTDGIQGVGIVDMAMESIGAAIAAEKYGAHWFGGAGVPRAVIEHGQMWSDEARLAFREEWESIYSGATGNRVAVLQGGATMKPLSLSANDSQFIETRHLSIEEIARWYGVPPHLLQHLMRATFNNIEELGISFVRYSLISWLRIWEQVITQKLLTLEEQSTLFAEHNVDALLRGDEQARSAFYTAMISATIMTRNEARRLENLDPVPGGDTFLVQGALVPLDEKGRPQSTFVTPSAQQSDSSGASPVNPVGISDAFYRVVPDRLKRVVEADLRRFVTKETKAIARIAKTTTGYVQRIDAFYESHTELLKQSLSPALDAMLACGIHFDSAQFVPQWIGEAKTLALSAADLATNNEGLEVAVSHLLESPSWTERPRRAVEGLYNASVSF